MDAWNYVATNLERLYDDPDAKAITAIWYEIYKFGRTQERINRLTEAVNEYRKTKV